MGRVLPEFLSKWTTERVREEGVNVIPNTEVKNVDSVGNQIKLTLANGQTILCDRVVVAVGSEPNTGLGRESGLEIESKHGGYLVNAELAARNNLYVVSIDGINIVRRKALLVVSVALTCCLLFVVLLPLNSRK